MSGVDLKIERVRLGLRQYRVAAALDVPQTTLSAWENGRRPVSAEQAAAVREALRRLSSASRRPDRRPPMSPSPRLSLEAREAILDGPYERQLFDDPAPPTPPTDPPA